jgi:hypothetical protein
MAPLRKLTLVALVWLTSVMTVAAGVPEMVCQCAKSGKTESAGAAKKPSTCGCNCGGQCCSGRTEACCSSTKQSASASSSSRQRRSTAQPRGAGVCVHTGRCIRTLATNPASLSDQGKKNSSSELTSRPVPLFAAIGAVPTAANNLHSAIPNDRGAHFSSDLITALQRFNI